MDYVKEFAGIRPTAYPTVQTMDMGMEFELITEDGFYSELGCFGDWPLYEFEGVSEAERDKIMSALNNGSITLDLLCDTGLFGIVDIIERHQRAAGKGPFAQEALSALLRPLCPVLTTTLGPIYAYCDAMDWTLSFEFFATYAELEKSFVDSYPVTPWERLGDACVKECYETVIVRHEQGLHLRRYNRSERDDND